MKFFYENPNAMASGDRTSPPIGSDSNQAFRGERLIPVLGLLLTENIKYGAHNCLPKSGLNRLVPEGKIV